MSGIVCSSIGNRLGNQMSNIACGITLAKKLGKDFAYIRKEYGSLNSASYTEYKWIVDKFNRLPLEETSSFTKIQEAHSQKFIELDDYKDCENIVLNGIFHCDKYYDKELVLDTFGNTVDDKRRIKSKYGDLSSYVSLSVRRGDFLHCRNTFIVPSKEWYETCYGKYFNGSDVLVTSDDLKWCRDNIDFIPSGKVHFLTNCDAVETMKIKQCCKKHIVPPSTYSWWSAYLSGDDSFVVVPNIWYGKHSGISNEERYPNDWIRENLV